MAFTRDRLATLLELDQPGHQQSEERATHTLRSGDETLQALATVERGEQRREGRKGKSSDKKRHAQPVLDPQVRAGCGTDDCGTEQEAMQYLPAPGTRAMDTNELQFLDFAGRH